MTCLLKSEPEQEENEPACTAVALIKHDVITNRPALKGKCCMLSSTD